MNDLFEVISETEYKSAIRAEKKARGRTLKTEPRNNTTWFTLPVEAGFCTCPRHEEVQRALNPEQKEYRQKYPTRHVYEIRDGMFICRDCFVHGVDK